MKDFLRKYAIKGLIVAISILFLAQILPIFPRTNPPVGKEPAWDRPETRVLAKRACFDCHSNETIWPWYAHIAPISWLVVYDVDEGRSEFNFSEWHPVENLGKIAALQIKGGKMPLPQYLLLHPEARLTDTEKEDLIRGLQESMK